MKKSVFFIILVLFYCCKNDDIDDENDETENIEIDETPSNTKGFVVIENDVATQNIFIDLRSSPNLKIEDLTYTSLLTDSIPQQNGYSIVKTLSSDTYELVIGSDKEDRLQLLSYTNPQRIKEPVISAETTAIALVLMSPWAYDLSKEGIAETISYLPTLTEYYDLTNEIKFNLFNGNLDAENLKSYLPLMLVLEAHLTAKKASSKGPSIIKKPLLYNFDGNDVTVTNTRSSATYGIGLYDEQGKYVSNEISQGVEKLRYISNGLTLSALDAEAIAKFDIKTDGQWTLKAKSGLSFDGSSENSWAAFYNIRNMAFNTFGVFSSELKGISACSAELGEKIYNTTTTGGVPFADILKSYGEEKISGLELSSELFLILKDNTTLFWSVILECFPKAKLYKLEGMGRLMKKVLPVIRLWNGLKGAFNGGALLADLVQYDKEINICFSKKQNEYLNCENLLLEIDSDFGDVAAFSNNIRTLKITNISELEQNLYLDFDESIGFGPGEDMYWATHEDAVKFATTTLAPDDELNIDIKFFPKEIRAYNPKIVFITSNNDLEGGNDIIDFSADVKMNSVSIIISEENIYPFNDDKSQNGFLDFEVQITNNNSNSTLYTKQAFISIDGTPEIHPFRYYSTAPSLYFDLVEIPPSQTVSIPIHFNRYYVHEFKGKLEFEFRYGGRENYVEEIPFEFVEGATVGYTVNIDGNPLGISRETIDFGSRSVNAGWSSKSILLYNHLYDPAIIQSIQTTGDFTINSNFISGELTNIENIAIKFVPSSEGQRNGELIINSDTEEPVIKIPLTGIGVQ